jgi:L-asparagine oxygenase
MRILRLELTEQERTNLSSLVAEMSSAIGGDREAFLNGVFGYSSDLPPRIVEAALEFSSLCIDDVLLIRGLPTDLVPDDFPTPTHHRIAADAPLKPWDILHGSIASLLGQIYAYTGQQGGNLFSDIVPLHELADVQNTSAGFRRDFNLHTEDAFHAFRPDYFCLLSLRNDEGVPVRLAGIRDVQLAPDAADRLFSDKFLIGSNPLHVGVEAGAQGVPILWGGRRVPFMRYNSKTSVLPGEDGAKAAFDSLSSELARNAVAMPMPPGSALYVDNRRVAHGRSAYAPAPEGRERWLLRTVASRDFFGNPSAHAGPHSRLVRS